MRRALALAVVALVLVPVAARAAVSGAQATAIAARLPLVRSEERTHPGAFSQVSSVVAGQWQVAFYSRNQEFVQVIVSVPDGRVLGQYTGFQVAWTMARGYPGAFGRHLDALYIWLPLCLLFLAPFFDWRRPARMLNLDLLVLTSLSISLAFFNHADIYQSVPLSYPPLLYLMARLLWLARPGAPRPPPLRLNFGSRLAGARAGVPDRLPDRPERRRLERHRRRLRERRRGPEGAFNGTALYGQFPSSIGRGDTYGPVPSRSPTRRSSRSGGSAATGTICRPRTRRRSSSTC